ncbi:unnamed protein product [Closterium sp. NIES-64]|nr:unnamed protein product [Closterium sp. NIES-64]
MPSIPRQSNPSATPTRPAPATLSPLPQSREAGSPVAASIPDPLTSRAIRLVYKDDQGVFRMDPEAVSALRRLRGPLGVVALLGRSSGFTVGPTHRPCTKGLWIWSSPVKVTAPDGSSYHLLLLDSEGIDAYDQTGTYSTQIFSLAVLLSSLFVYNQMGGIDESSLDRLSMVTEMAKHIQVRANSASSAAQGGGGAGGAAGAAGSSSTTQELGLFSPVFFWLLRVSFCGHSKDFYFDLTEDGRVITPRDYLETALQSMAEGSESARAKNQTALQSMAEGSESARAKNQIRESIRSLFPDRDCFALVRPISNERLLQKLDHLPVSTVRFDMLCLAVCVASFPLVLLCLYLLVPLCALVRPISNERLLQKLDHLPVSAVRFYVLCCAVLCYGLVLYFALRALVRPISSERLLQKLDHLPMDQLRPEFKQGLDAFTQAVFARAVSSLYLLNPHSFPSHLSPRADGPAPSRVQAGVRSLHPGRVLRALSPHFISLTLTPSPPTSPRVQMDQLRPEFKQGLDAFTQAMDQLRPEFKQGLDAFTQAVFARARPKRVGGTVMTGPMLAGLTQTYIQALNNGAVPTILNSWLSVEETECRRAFEVALEAYSRAFGSPASADEDDLRAHHRAALQAAEAAFREEAVGEGQARHKYEEKLREEAGKRFEDVLKRVAAEAEDMLKRVAAEAKDVLKRVAAEAEVRCKRYLDALEAKVKGLARGPPRAATADVVHALIAELAAYESSMSGAAKWRCLSAFLVASMRGLVLDSAEKEVAEARQQASSALKDKQAAEARASAEAAAAAREAAAAEDWKKRVATVEGQLAAANRAVGEGREERERMRQEMEEGRRRADERERECAELRKEVERVREGGEKEVKRVSGEVEKVKGQLEEAKRRVGEEQGEKVKWRGMYEKEVGEGKREVEKVVGEREGLRGEVEREKQRRQAEVAAIQKEKGALEQQLRKEASKAAAEASELKVKLESQAARLAAMEKALVEAKARERQAEESMREASRTAGSASKSVQAAREAKATAEEATEKMERQLRQAESARTAAELATRREAELARQACIRADSAAKDLQMAMEEAQVAQSAAEVAGKRAEVAERRARELERELEGLRLRAAEGEEEGKGKVEGMVREIEELKGEVGRRKEEVGETMAMLAVCEVEREGWRRKEGEARTEMERLKGELERLRQVVEGMGVEMGVVRGEREEMKGVVRVREEEISRLRGMLEVAMRGNQERERERGRGEGRGGAGQGEGAEEMEVEEGEEAGRKRKRARLGTGVAGEGGIAGEGGAAGEGGTGGEEGAAEAGLTGAGGTAGGGAGAGVEGAGDSAVTGDAAGTAAGGEGGKRRGRGASKRAPAAPSAGATAAGVAGASGAAAPPVGAAAAAGGGGVVVAPSPAASGNTGFESAQATGQGSEMDMDSASFGGAFGAGEGKERAEGDEAESSKGGRGRGRGRRGGGGRRGRGRPAAGVGAVTAADVAGESDVAKRRREIAMKMTKSELKDRLTDEGRGLDVLEMRTPTKGQLVDLFVKFVQE